MRFNKAPLTYNEQISLLEERGLVFDDKGRAQRYLEHISYYRLSAYCVQFQETKDVFNPGTSFDDILRLYRFDKQLRLIVFDAIERIEVAIRTQMVYQLAHKYSDSHWQDNPDLFKPPVKQKDGKVKHVYAEIQSIIKKCCDVKNPEVFINHYKSKYSTPENPPSWMCLELLTVGELSRLFTSLANKDDKRGIADYFGMHHTAFASWLHTVTYVRNLCAHHARLWNREFAIKPELLIKPRGAWMTASFEGNNDRCFYFICILRYLLHSANPTSHFKEQLVHLLNKYRSVPIQYLGIPTDKYG